MFPCFLHFVYFCFMLRSPSAGISCLRPQVRNHPPAQHVKHSCFSRLARHPPVTAGSRRSTRRPSKAWNCHLSNHSSPNRSRPWHKTLETFRFWSLKIFQHPRNDLMDDVEPWPPKQNFRMILTSQRQHCTPIRHTVKEGSEQEDCYIQPLSIMIWVVLFPQPDLLDLIRTSSYVSYCFICFILPVASCHTTNTINTTPSGQTWTARSHVSKARNLRVPAWWLPRGVWWRPSGEKNHSPFALVCTG